MNAIDLPANAYKMMVYVMQLVLTFREISNVYATKGISWIRMENVKVRIGTELGKQVNTSRKAQLYGDGMCEDIKS